MTETIVFIHGWSVTHTDTYGGLPERLAAEASAVGQTLLLRDLWLTRYVSFRDEVRMEDLARAMEYAVRREAGMRAEAMAALYSMNITQSTLFPGLDGLARSMAYEFEYSWAMDPATNIRRASLQDPGYLPPFLANDPATGSEGT